MIRIEMAIILKKRDSSMKITDENSTVQYMDKSRVGIIDVAKQAYKLLSRTPPFISQFELPNGRQCLEQSKISHRPNAVAVAAKTRPCIVLYKATDPFPVLLF